MAAPGQAAELSKLLALVRHDIATTRADLQAELGWSRVTVGKRLDELLNAGIIGDSGTNLSTGGRPSSSLAICKDFGVLLAVDIGGSQAHLAVTDFAGEILLDFIQPTTVDDGPEVLFGWVRHQFRRLLKHLGLTDDDVRGIGIGIPGPVDIRRGTIVHPPIMPGWHGVRVANYFTSFGDHLPIAVDRDANVVALGEFQSWRQDTQDIVVLKAGEGITTSAVLGGTIYRGANGLAGEIGHLNVTDGRQCRCGRYGCLESVAGGWALRDRLSEVGWELETSTAVADLAKRGDSRAIELLAQAGERLGVALGNIVCALNPSTVVVTGALSEAGGLLLNPIQQALQRAVPDYVLNAMSMAPSRIGESAGVLGAALAAQDRATDVTHLARLLGE